VVEHQRARLLTAAVAAVDELGWSQATVGQITARAHVSRRTFYALFIDREDCLLAVLKDTAQRLTVELRAAELDHLSWRERIRTGLWRILCFFEADPALARVCVVQSARGGQAVLEYREGTLAALTAAIDEGRGESARAAECPRLTAEGLAGATLSILYARLLNGEREPLDGLLGELMATIVLPYRGSAAAARELSRPAPEPAPAARERLGASLTPAGVGRARIPFRLTVRTHLVLSAVAELSERGANPNNREVSDAAGVSDQGQISKLLSRLEGHGLLQNTGGQTQGIPRAWRLTPRGEEIVRVGQSRSDPKNSHPRSPKAAR